MASTLTPSSSLLQDRARSSVGRGLWGPPRLPAQKQHAGTPGGQQGRRKGTLHAQQGMRTHKEGMLMRNPFARPTTKAKRALKVNDLT
eukprot:969170-Pelagomonas_calceolata.AAC.2